MNDCFFRVFLPAMLSTKVEQQKIGTRKLSNKTLVNFFWYKFSTKKLSNKVKQQK